MMEEAERALTLLAEGLVNWAKREEIMRVSVRRSAEGMIYWDPYPTIYTDPDFSTLAGDVL